MRTIIILVFLVSCNFSNNNVDAVQLIDSSVLDASVMDSEIIDTQQLTFKGACDSHQSPGFICQSTVQ